MDQKLISGGHLQGTWPGSMSFYVLIIHLKYKYYLLQCILESTV